MARVTHTRGKNSTGDKVFASTSGNFEVQPEDVSRIVDDLGIELNSAFFDQLMVLINWRITETRNQYLSWEEAEPHVSKLVRLAEQTASTLDDVSNLGQNEISRPHGQSLLGSIDYDFDQEMHHQKTNWIDVAAWLRFMAARIENEFILIGNRAKPYREFIKDVNNTLNETDGRTSAIKKHPHLVSFLSALDELFANLVFPPDTIPQARRDYINNAFRK